MGGRGSRPPNFFTASAKIAEIRAPTVREGYTRRLPQPFPNGRGSVQLFHALWRRPRRHGWLLKVPPIKGGVGGVLRVSRAMFATGHPPARPSKGK